MLLAQKEIPKEPCFCGLPSAQLTTLLFPHRAGTGHVCSLTFASTILVILSEDFQNPEFFVAVLAVPVKFVLGS